MSIKPYLDDGSRRVGLALHILTHVEHDEGMFEMVTAWIVEE